jgi:histidyl-tRNA synthetase
VAEWLRRGLQILLSQFDSGRGLQKIKLFYILKKSNVADYSSVAQLVEQLTVNQLVAGSSPARGAKFYPTFEILFETCNDLLNFNF